MFGVWAATRDEDQADFGGSMYRVLRTGPEHRADSILRNWLMRNNRTARRWVLEK